MVWNWNSAGPVGEGSLSNKRNLVSSVSGSFITEIKSHVYANWQMWIWLRDQVSSYLIVIYCFIITSTKK